MPIEFKDGEHWSIRVGDVFAGLATVADKSVHAVVTSPPYWGLRDYGFEGQIGSEDTPEDFMSVIVRVFAEMRRVLRDDGVVFLNLGDSYSSGGRSGGYRGKNKGHRGVSFRADPPGMDFGNKIGIPWRVALALQADGWILRQDIIWAKASPMPESIAGWRWVKCKVATKSDRPHSVRDESGKNFASVTRDDCPGCDKCRDNNGMILRKGSWRATTSHEYIFQFVKSQSYFCDGDGSKEATAGTAHSRGKGVNPKSVNGVESRQNGSFSAAVNQIVETRNQRSVWRVSSESYKEAHFATYPTELVRRCLIAATSRGGCCSACGMQYAPVVESKRTATRPGTNSKVNRVSVHDDSPYQSHSGDICGNRDPQRHTTSTVVTGYLPSCGCGAEKSRPVVLDPFSGSGTTGQVAINMGCNYIGCEGNPEYAELSVKRLNTPWKPVGERKKSTVARRIRISNKQRELFK